ncbi:hypothetical protein [Antribacter gilvus]|uniref:hypothetical protein n=1 Tax=Antribacter gilvus TaxID=2304675 RepID=UPI000F7AD1E5|nr:hypothetical protein [Antribacter gilvus]
MSPLGRGTAVAAAVIAAMALGRVVTETWPVNDVTTAPFVRSGAVAEPVRTEYATITVDGVRAARTLVTGGLSEPPAATAGGVFLVADVTVRATRRTENIDGLYLVDAEGLRHEGTARGGCATGMFAPAGVDWHAMACFDVAPDVLEGAYLVVARGGGDLDGYYQARDEVVHVDLALTADRAAQLAASTETYATWLPGPEPYDTRPWSPEREAP